MMNDATRMCLKTFVPSEQDVEKQKFERKVKEKKRQRTRCYASYPYGKMPTFMTIAFSFLGLVTSLLAKRSTSFLVLHKSLAPLDIIYIPTYYLGLYRIQLCTGRVLNESAVHGEHTLSYTDLYYNSTNADQIFRRELQDINEIFFRNESDCKIVRLSAAEVRDKFWSLARFSSALAALCGIVVFSWSVVSCCSSKVNVKAVGFLGLVTYLFESLTFTIFASRLCDDLGCNLSLGGCLGLIASLCWFSASLSAINMHYRHQKRLLVDSSFQLRIESPTEPQTSEAYHDDNYSG